MIALLLMLASSWAQEPQAFDPVPADVEIAGELLSGILVDEATFIELGSLRVLTREQKIKLDAYTDFGDTLKLQYALTVTSLTEEHERGQAELVLHYEKALDKEKKKDAFQRHGFGLGIATGAVLTTIITIVVLNVYDETLPDSITGN